MAKQSGPFFIEGTLDDLTFYKMDGVHYVRMKSSLTGKKFWKDKVFERSRESCNRFGEGNKLASQLYRMVEKEKRQYKLFCFLKNRCILLIKEGKPVAHIEQELIDYLEAFGFIEKIKARPVTEEATIKKEVEIKENTKQYSLNFDGGEPNDKITLLNEPIIKGVGHCFNPPFSKRSLLLSAAAPPGRGWTVP